MTNKNLSLLFLIIAVGCFAAILIFLIPYFFIEKNSISVSVVIDAIVVCILGISAFITSRSYSRKERDD